MISIQRIEFALAKRRATPNKPLGMAMAQIVNDANLVSLLLSVAEFCGWQEDGEGGRFQLWTLRKPIPGHPAGSTVTRETIRRALGMNHGTTSLPETLKQEFSAIESPAFRKQRAADAASEEKAEARVVPEQRKNFHE